MEKKQTAVEWLAEQITTLKWKMSDITDRNSIIEQAKAMEKEQIMEAYDYMNADIAYNKKAETYYNEFYGKQSED
jgi:hypothetical protein